MHTRSSRNSAGLILLAAGESRRMGVPKQLLPFAGTTLIRHACLTALASMLRPIVAVLGSSEQECRREIADLSLECVSNPDWASGMGGSIRAGVAKLTELAPELDGVGIMLADQPKVTSSQLNELLAAWSSHRGSIAAAEYGNVFGVPAIFGCELFGELSKVTGQEGARAVIGRHSSDTIRVKMPTAAFDMDTPEDYRRILGSL